MSLRVTATGPLSLVQDLGRPGRTDLGVGRSGAADRAALALANRAVGNAEGAAGLEVTYGGLALDVEGPAVLVCVTGAPCPVRVDGREVGPYAAVPARRSVRLGTPERGLRSYLAVRGGLDVEPVLGSRSTDVLSGLGPAPLAEGDRLPVGRPAYAVPGVDGLVPPAVPGPDEAMLLRVVRGPRDGWVAGDLAAGRWRVDPRSDRVGMRLGGRTLPHRPDAPALPSEGAWRGAVQVPPGGEPVVFLADHPVTGGYPVVAVVVDDDVDLAAQARPGQPICFEEVRR